MMGTAHVSLVVSTVMLRQHFLELLLEQDPSIS